MKKIFLLLMVVSSIISAQNKIEYFPSELNVRPFIANNLEPKMGILLQTGGNELRLDIGNSVDLMKINIDQNANLSIGSDFFTFTLLRGERNFHFPVDAVDYLFGINVSYKISKNLENYGFRFRLSHISAHFVDGHFDGNINSWRNNRSPRVYSREFIELIGFYEIEKLRLYAGGRYIFHIDPESIKKDNYQFGFEYFAASIFDDLITPFAAYDFQLIHLNEYTGTNSVSLGVKFGKANQKGLSLYLNYFSGMSIHGEYYDYKKKFTAIGINLDI